MGGQSAQGIARLSPDGTPDSSFVVNSYSFGPSILLPDGSVLTAFATNLARIKNSDPAAQTLAREGSTLTWMRAGSCPELFHARFQVSLDGITWTDAGDGERINGGWRLQNASIPAGARLRARGYVTGTSWHVDYLPDSADPLNGIIIELVARKPESNETTLTATLAGPGAIIQMSTDLRQWTSVQTNSFSQQFPTTLSNQNAPFAFYRVFQTGNE